MIDLALALLIASKEVPTLPEPPQIPVTDTTNNLPVPTDGEGNILYPSNSDDNTNHSSDSDSNGVIFITPTEEK